MKKCDSIAIVRILLTEDDVDLAKITAMNLKKDGFAVDTAYSGKEAWELFEGDGGYDVVVLDLNLPDIDGLELFKDLKAKSPNLRVLALTARDAEEDRVNGFKAGLDDYLVKPFSPHELAARLRVLYRSQPQSSVQIIKTGPLQINVQAQTAMVNGIPVKLSLNEFRVLHYLAKNKGEKVSIQELLESVWDRNAETKRGKVLTTVSRLRKKIGSEAKLIKTCRGGYLVEK